MLVGTKPCKPVKSNHKIWKKTSEKEFTFSKNSTEKWKKLTFIIGL